MKHLPFVFNTAAGTVTLHARNTKHAIKRAKQVIGDYHYVPAFTVEVRTH